MRFPGPLKILNGRGAAPAPAADPTGTAQQPTALEISAELKKRIQYLYVAHVSAAGVDYPAMKESPEFAAYVSQTRLLNTLDIWSAFPDDAHKISFFVNLYNALTQHAVVVLGPPPSASLMRLFYCMMTGYTVGPFRFSLNDIENGILRANKSIAVLPRPFGRSDPRRRLCVDRVDPRIHFVLNCAANSCPPVLFLTAENLESSLKMAVQGFLKNQGNLEMADGQVCLSKIFDWYRGDFASDGTDKGLLEFVAAHGDPEQVEIMEVKRVLAQRPEKIPLVWKTYDWSLNST